jgi:hypothetical protein
MSEKTKLTDYEISMLLIERNTAQFRAEQIDELLNKIGEAKGYADAENQESVTEKKETSLPGSEDLSKLPWRSYKTKQDAKEEEAAWIFSDTHGAEALSATLRSKDGKATIGPNTYTLQGDKKQFISRRPARQ